MRRARRNTPPISTSILPPQNEDSKQQNEISRLSAPPASLPLNNNLLSSNKKKSSDSQNLSEKPLPEEDAKNEINDEGLLCDICYEQIIEQGIIECCQHHFCFACIKRWSQVWREF